MARVRIASTSYNLVNHLPRAFAIMKKAGKGQRAEEGIHVWRFVYSPYGRRARGPLCNISGDTTAVAGYFFSQRCLLSAYSFLIECDLVKSSAEKLRFDRGRDTRAARVPGDGKCFAAVGYKSSPREGHGLRANS